MRALIVTIIEKFHGPRKLMPDGRVDSDRELAERDRGVMSDSRVDEYAARLQRWRDEFERLSPGRQRGYLLHFNGANQSATRTARIERVQDRIMEGFGMHD